MYKVDLNSDLGESFGSYTIGMDREVIRHVSSVNVACGWHGGDPLVMEHTVAMAKEFGTAVGAHPGFLDLMGFGRRNIAVTPQEAKAYTKYQIGALMAFTTAKGIRLQHVKPHGALYNMAAVDYPLARAIAEGIYEVDKELIFLALAGSQMLKAAADIGLRAASEVFADRGYMEDGTLVPRKMPGAMIHDQAEGISRVIRMVKEGKVPSVTGKEIPIKADSICVHGDNPQAVQFVLEIKKALQAEGISLASLREMI